MIQVRVGARRSCQHRKEKCMLRTAKEYIKANYLSEELSFQYRIYMIFFAIAFLASMISATTNTLLGKGVLGITVQWIFNAVFLALLFSPLEWRMKSAKFLLIIISFFYIPFLFFQTAGYNGTAGLIEVLGVFLLTILFRGKLRIFLIILNILVWVAICAIQFTHPETVIPHDGEREKFVDYAVALIVAYGGIALLGIFFRNSSDLERHRIKKLLKEIEEKNKVLSELSHRDPLTCLHNRRFLVSFLERELETCRENNTPLCLMMLDIDLFKKINDNYGHGFGDEVLIQFAATVQSNLRSYDVFARYGGEEFVVVLHNIDLEGALVIAERTRAAVAQMEFRGGAKITVSGGIIPIRADDSVESLLSRADVFLYKAKNSGRDRIIAEE